jgi:hypothetical protein
MACQNVVRYELNLLLTNGTTFDHAGLGYIVEQAWATPGTKFLFT